MDEPRQGTVIVGPAARERWGSQLGFTLASIGSAVGLGNVWRFSYVAGDNGGAAFILLYLLTVTLLGVPLMIAEFAVGRRGRSDPVGTFRSLAPGTAWIAGGYLAVGAAFAILSYYGVISGWVARYLIGYLTGELADAPTTGFARFFTAFTGRTLEPLAWLAGFMAVTITIVALGVRRGIERSNKILMPLLALLLVGLAAFTLGLDGAAGGIDFLLRPDWSILLDPGVYIAAVGQAFFSLSLGMGTLLTYGSYVPRDVQLPRVAISVVACDTLVSITAGLVIFPAVFSFGIDPASGPPLVFIVLPGIFAAIPGGSLVGLAFFSLLAAAALSSAVSLLEVVVAYAMRAFRWSRFRSGILLGLLITLLAIPSSLGYGVLCDVELCGRSILDGLDLLTSQVLLPIGGLILALFVGWGWKWRAALEESGLGGVRAGKWWLIILRFVAPLLILLILVGSLVAP